mgnify:CR=1 FL=1
MKFEIAALLGLTSAITLSKPLIHPQTGLAITTTGQHWYGQPPLAMAEKEEENLNTAGDDFRGPKALWPLKPEAKKFEVKFPPRKFDDKGYDAPEKVANLKPEVHMEVNNLDSTYLWPRTAFYVQTNQEKLEDLMMLQTQGAPVEPVENTCTNANKATGADEDCSAPGNSAWNTFSTSRTGEPKDAQAAPYPGHTLH